ncbi:TrmH family RNA methyltransferase [Hydrogenimonas sp.]
MQVVVLEDLDLPQLAPYKTLRANRMEADGGFIADSPRVVSQLLKSGLRFKSLLCTPEYFEAMRHAIEAAGVPTVYLGERSLLSTIVGHKIHHHVMAHCIAPPEVPLEAMPDRIVMPLRLNNLENIGAIARNAAALEVGGMVAPRSGPHPYGRRAIRVSTGHVTRLAIHLYDDLFTTMARLQSLGYTLIAAEKHPDAVPLSRFSAPEKWALILGNEEEGVPPEVVERSDAVVAVEMAERVASFNVATAAALVMYRLRYGDGL